MTADGLYVVRNGVALPVTLPMLAFALRDAALKLNEDSRNSQWHVGEFVMATLIHPNDPVSP